MLLQKCTLQPVTLVYSMVLARLLTKEEMGVMGLTAIFFTAAGTLAAGGFGSALIRKQNYFFHICLMEKDIFLQYFAKRVRSGKDIMAL